MFTYPKFEVEIAWDVDLGQLSWPVPGAAVNDSGLGCNREYFDLRRRSWTDATDVYEAEGRLIARIEAAEDPEAEYEAIEDEDAEEPNDIEGLDIGVASSVFALSAARCIPFSSCNGGAFGGRHYEEHPLVAFYTRPELIEPILECARDANAGVTSHSSGAVVAYADDIRHMRIFAHLLIERRKTFRAVRLSRRENTQDATPIITQQLNLL